MREQPVSWGAFCAGLAGLLALILFTVFGEHPLSPKAVQDLLRVKIEAALEAQDLDFVTVTMRGQTAVLTGAAPDAARRAAAERAALLAAGPGGPWRGGVARVRNDLSLVDPEGLFAWRAVWREGRLRLEGSVPDAESQAALRDRAEALFPGAAQDASATASGAPGGAGWRKLALASLHHLARLSQGEARMVDGRLFLLGEGDERALEAARRFARSAAAPFEVTVDVVETGALVSLDGGGAVELGAPSASLCARLLREAAFAHPLEFEPRAAVLSRTGRARLEAVARLARRCDGHGLVITGRARAPATPLGRGRGQALAKAFALAGVRRDRLRIADALGDGGELRLGVEGGATANGENDP